jgi:hypothetical protein
VSAELKSDQGPSFYLPKGSADVSGEVREAFLATPATAGPWSSEAQHGGPPAALLGRALERLEPDLGRTLGRFTMDLLGPVPVGPVSVTARVLRPGRSISLLEAVMHDDGHPGGPRPVARAQAWAFPVVEGGPGERPSPLSHTYADGHEVEPPASWSRGYLDAIEWRWIDGAIGTPGAAVVWMRPRLPLVDGEEPSPRQRLLTCVDSASGASAVLDPAEWGFLNSELSVHLVRAPESEWICLRAATTLGQGAVGLATADLYDERGWLGRSAQALLVVARS